MISDVMILLCDWNSGKKIHYARSRNALFYLKYFC